MARRPLALQTEIDRKTLQLIFRAIRTSFKRSERYTKIKAENLALDVGPNGGKRWFCSLCGITTTEVEVDHSPEPVISPDRRWFSYSVAEFYSNVFFLPCRVLCRGCHKSETAAQRKSRQKPPKKKAHQ